MAASKLVLEGRVSISAFLAGLSVILIPLFRTWFGHVDWVFDYLTETPGKVAICLQVLVVNGLLLLLYRGPVYRVRAALDNMTGFWSLGGSSPVQVTLVDPLSGSDATCSHPTAGSGLCVCRREQM